MLNMITVPTRPSAILASTCARKAGATSQSCVIGVSMKVGQTVSTRMRCGPSSSASALLKPSSACLVAQVRGAPDGADGAHLRRHLHDRARQAGRLAAARHLARHQERSLEVEPVERVEVVLADLVDGLRAIGAGVVDEHLERAVGGDRARHGGGVRDIENDGARREPHLGTRLGTHLGKSRGAGQSEPAAGTGDPCAAAIEPEAGGAGQRHADSRFSDPPRPARTTPGRAGCRSAARGCWPARHGRQSFPCDTGASRWRRSRRWRRRW